MTATNAVGISPEEWTVRVELAATYRLVHHYGWDDMIFTHISARVPGPEHHFLINPFGLLFSEVRASNLVKVDQSGNTVGESEYPINQAGFVIHSAVHAARSDARCVIHLHSDDGSAAAAQSCGLMPISQHAMMLASDLAYHDYEGVALDLDERQRLVDDLGEKNIMLLRNHGTLTCGSSCAEAFMRMYYLERACTIQVRALSSGIPPASTNQGVPEKAATQGYDAMAGMADAAWPALLRLLDRQNADYLN